MGTKTATRPKGGTQDRPAGSVSAEPAVKTEAPAKPAAPVQTGGKVSYVEVPPNAAKTLTAIREMGYDSYASIMDLVDNSVDAKASKIAVQVKEQGKGNIVIDVLDNGKGMDETVLAQALRLGSDTEHANTDLGKYGFGLVSASLSMAQSIYVLTRRNKAQAFEAVFDMATIRRENRFIITLTPANGAKVFETLGDQGTLVRLSQIDRISDTNVARFAANLRAKFAQVYREFIKQGLTLSVNNRIVKAEDPLMRDHPSTEKRLEQEIKFGEGKSAWLTIVELPDLGQIGNEQAGILPHRSGFYVVRNGRQIMEAQTFGYYRHHHSYTGFRAELSFNGSLDDLFHVDIKKSIIHPDDKLLEKLRDVAGKYIEQAGRTSRASVEPAKLKLDTAVDTLNQRLRQVAAPAIPAGQHGTKFIDQAQGTPVKGVPVEGVDVKAPTKKGEKAPEQAKVEAPTPAPAPEAEHTPRVRFEDFEGETTGRLYESVEKGGQWLIRLNSKHPLVRLAAEAKHKQASAIVSYLTFALARIEGREANHAATRKVVLDLSQELALLLGAQPE